MASEKHLEELHIEQGRRRQDDHRSRELKEEDLLHKSPEEQVKMLEEQVKMLREALKTKDETLRTKDEALEIKEKQVQELIANQKNPATPRRDGSSVVHVSPVKQNEKNNTLVALSTDWKRPFLGNSLNVLKKLLLDEEKVFQEDKFYAKSITIIQSSGTGKSRLLDELSKRYLTVSFALRRPNDDIMWPPGDHEITTFLTCSIEYGELVARAVALLAAALAELAAWCNVQPPAPVEEMAKKFHEEMAPRDARPTETASRGLFQKHIELRSKSRINFIKRTVKVAEELYIEFINHHAWMDAYKDSNTMAKHELVQKHLIQPALDLTNYLNKLPQESENTKELLIFVFDEAANLWTSTKRGKNGNSFYALRRVLGLFKNTPIWSFLLSTQSTIGSLLPPREIDRSHRIRTGELSTLEPFTALRLSINASQAVASAEGFNKELRKPMSKFATADHMTLFGRPLWRAYYSTVSSSALRHFALEKLIHNTDYNCEDAHHVFAALASRLCLDVCMEKAEAIALAHEAVNSYLRIIINIDPYRKGEDHSNSSEANDSDKDHSNLSTSGDLDKDNSSLGEKIDSGEQQLNRREGKDLDKSDPSRTGRQAAHSLARMVTITPSEPVVAEAVAERLCEGTNWGTSICTLTTHLLSKGLVEKGTKGELVARLLCILARDIHLRDIHRRDTEKATDFPYAKTFSVNDFVQSLFGKKWFQEIEKFKPKVPQTRTWEGSETASFYEVFKKGSMNFTHFTYTDVLLPDQTMSELLHMLLWRQQALQLAQGEPAFDILIPVYFGDLEHDFDPARTSAVVISVRNRGAASKLPLEAQHYKKFFHTNDPILCILMDLGVKNATTDVQGLPKRPSKQYVFGIHAEGAGVKTFGCLQDIALGEDASKALLQQILEINDPRGVLNDHDELSRRNFEGHYCQSWREQFPEIKEWEQVEGRDAEVQDTEGEDAEERDVVVQLQGNRGTSRGTGHRHKQRVHFQ